MRPPAVLCLSLLLIAGVAGAPLFSVAHVPHGYDTSFHFWRAVQAERLLRAGVLFPRWAPDMAGGYGYPLFIFQGALSAQLAALLHMIGLGWPLALNVVYLAGLAGSVLTLFLLARQLWGDVGGWGGAVLFAFVPYHLYVVYYRCSLSETLAWLFPPLVLWGLTRWLDGRRQGLWVGALALAGLAMTHPVSLYLFAPLFGLWALAESAGHETGQRWRALGRGVLLLGLGAALGAFAWMPGLLERNFVNLGQATSAWVFDYRENFLPLDQLLPLPRSADPHLLNDWPPRGLGLLFVLAALSGLLMWYGSARRARFRIAVLALATLLYAFCSTSASRPLWDAIPLLATFQFPWRFLAPATLSMVVLAGAGVAWLSGRPRCQMCGVALMALVAVAHWGWLYPNEGTLPGPASVAGMLAWEQATDTVGTTASRELLPRWVKQMPAEDNDLTMAFLRDVEPHRLDRAALPEGAVVSVLFSNRATLTTLRISSPRDFQARYLAFYYPGWRVSVDGVAVDVTPEPETGLVAFPVPAGDHTLDIRFGETPLRWTADALSLVALLAITLIVLRPSPLQTSAADGLVSISPVAGCRSAVIFLSMTMTMVMLKFLVADQVPVLWRQSRLRTDGVFDVAMRLDANFDGRAVLFGVDPLPTTFAADASPAITLYWRALNPGGGDWHVGLDLIGPDGSRWAAVGLRPARWMREPPPMAEWPADAYARMDYQVDIAPGTPPGEYALSLSLFDRETLVPASVLGEDGNPLGPALSLGQIRLERPEQTPSLVSFALPGDAALRQCGALGLWEMTTDRALAAPGDLVALRWVWEALAAPGEALYVTLSLRDEAGALVRRWNFPPAAAWWSTELWQPGDRWVGRPQVRLPGSLESGEYQLVLTVPGCAEALASVSLTVQSPVRLWAMSDDFMRLDTTFGEKVRLAGYRIEEDVLAAGDTLSLHLAWQALVEIDASYWVFVHVVGADGRLLGQSDGEPSGWTRPTTGWAVDEVVLDERDIPIPQMAVPGRYEVRVGLYDPEGARLLTPDGQDGVVVGVVRVGE